MIEPKIKDRLSEIEFKIKFVNHSFCVIIITSELTKNYKDLIEHYYRDKFDLSIIKIFDLDYVKYNWNKFSSIISQLDLKELEKDSFTIIPDLEVRYNVDCERLHAIYWKMYDEFTDPRPGMEFI